MSLFQVKHIAGQCNCGENPFMVLKLSEGRYNIGGKNMFVRVSIICLTGFVTKQI